MDSRHFPQDVRIQVIDIALSHIWNKWPDVPRYDVEYLGTSLDKPASQVVEWNSTDKKRQVAITAMLGKKQHVHRANSAEGSWFRVESSLYDVINGWWNVARCKECGTVSLIGPFHACPAHSTAAPKVETRSLPRLTR